MALLSNGISSRKWLMLVNEMVSNSTFYYSHLDWGREDYPQGRTGLGTGRDKGKANWSSYYKFMNTPVDGASDTLRTYRRGVV